MQTGFHSRVAFFLLLFLALLPAPSQTQPPLEFDVASIKPAKDFPGQRVRNNPGSLEISNMEPTTMIRNAYRLVMEGQLTGFPSWADKDCFDIEATADEDPAIDLAEARQRNLLRLQSLLVSRFQLRTHWEDKMQHGYVLAIGKKGWRLKPLQPGSKHSTSQGRGRLVCRSCTISTLAGFLSNIVQKPVQDDTGIQGLYDLNLAFEPPDADPSVGTGLPSLFTTLSEQLGLKLEPRNILVRTLVIDHIERPSSN